MVRLLVALLFGVAVTSLQAENDPVGPWNTQGTASVFVAWGDGPWGCTHRTSIVGPAEHGSVFRVTIPGTNDAGGDIKRIDRPIPDEVAARYLREVTRAIMTVDLTRPPGRIALPQQSVTFSVTGVDFCLSVTMGMDLVARQPALKNVLANFQDHVASGTPPLLPEGGAATDPAHLPLGPLDQLARPELRIERWGQLAGASNISVQGRFGSPNALLVEGEPRSGGGKSISLSEFEGLYTAFAETLQRLTLGPQDRKKHEDAPQQEVSFTSGFESVSLRVPDACLDGNPALVRLLAKAREIKDGPAYAAAPGLPAPRTVGVCGPLAQWPDFRVSVSDTQLLASLLLTSMSGAFVSRDFGGPDRYVDVDDVERLYEAWSEGFRAVDLMESRGILDRFKTRKPLVMLTDLNTPEGGQIHVSIQTDILRQNTTLDAAMRQLTALERGEREKVTYPRRKGGAPVEALFGPLNAEFPAPEIHLTAGPASHGAEDWRLSFNVVTSELELTSARSPGKVPFSEHDARQFYALACRAVREVNLCRVGCPLSSDSVMGSPMVHLEVRKQMQSVSITVPLELLPQNPELRSLLAACRGALPMTTPPQGTLSEIALPGAIPSE